MIAARAPRAALALLALLLGAVILGAPAAGQRPDGEILGRLVQGSAGAPVPDGVTVQLIIVGAPGGLQSARTVSDAGGAFRFEVAADLDLSYIVAVQHHGLQYLSPPQLLSPELPTAEVELTLYELTSDPPELRIESTVVTLLALDRAAAQLTFERIDEVLNAADRVYVAGDEGEGGGPTLRLPLPDGVAEASGDGDFAVEGGVIASRAALWPGLSTVVTRYVVGYDRGEDAYTLRVTAPLATGRMEIEVPTRFIQGLEPLGESERADSREVSGEPVDVVARGEARPGESLSVRIEGLSGRNASNPLTDRGGALAGVLLALAVSGGGALLLLRARRGAGA